MKKKFKIEIPTFSYWQRQIKCQDACPVHTDARGYVRAIAEGDYKKSYAIARGPNPLASICGRICGAPCEVNCRRGSIDKPIAIRGLKRFACERYGVETRTLYPEAILNQAVEELDKGSTDSAIDEIIPLLKAFNAPLFAQKSPGKKVAIIGSGPAGLACAHDLAIMGFSPVIFEMEQVAGGFLYLGVPPYRLPREVITAEVEVIRRLGVEIKCNIKVGRDITLSQLRKDYSAVVIAVGAKYSRGLPVKNSNADGVIGGVEFLRSVALKEPLRIGSKVIVIGGGNVAYDVARTVLRQEEYDVARSAIRVEGVKEVHLCCLESLEEMPADDIEIMEGEEEGIIRHNSMGPHEIHLDNSGRVSGVTFKRTIRVYDEKKQFRPVFDEKTLTRIDCDTLLLSVGQRASFDFISPDSDGIRITDRGAIEHNTETLQVLGSEGVFIVGDAAHGTKLMIDAIASGKKAARGIYRYLKGKTIKDEQIEFHFPINNYFREKKYEIFSRVSLPVSDASARRTSISTLVELPISEKEAAQESSRCLDCGVNTIFNGENCILCGGCVDVCPELCLKLVSLSEIETSDEIKHLTGGLPADQVSVIIKDETCCIRCGLCAQRCPNEAITMERFCFDTKIFLGE